MHQRSHTVWIFIALSKASIVLILAAVQCLYEGVWDNSDAVTSWDKAIRPRGQHKAFLGCLSPFSLPNWYRVSQITPNVTEIPQGYIFLQEFLRFLLLWCNLAIWETESAAVQRAAWVRWVPSGTLWALWRCFVVWIPLTAWGVCVRVRVCAGTLGLRIGTWP